MGAVDMSDLFRLALSLTLGLLVGLERGWRKREEPDGSRALGLRTVGLIGLLGGVSALLSRPLGPWFPVACLLAVASLLAGSYYVSATPRDRGLTSEVAALLTFLLGAMAALGFEREAAAAAVVMTALLGFKPVLHAAVKKLGRAEFHAALQFLLVTVVVLPNMPDRGYGPWEAFNPYRVWLMVAVISGLSFAGYAAVKVLGPLAGTSVASLLGGVVSSTAVTLALARRHREQPGAWRLHAGGILLASSVMFPRVLVEVAAVNASLIPRLAAPLAAAALVGLAAAGLLIWRTGGGPSEGPELRNPLQLGAALFFAASIALVTLATVALRSWLGEGGVYATSAIAGVMDVDAVTLSMARLSRGDLSAEVAARGILIASGVNTLSKAAMAAVIARGRVGLVCAGALVAALAAGAAALAMSSPA
ncbi:MAG: MgtC/SapB family protein [Elusimicrobia bacterium]|nr:MgtC/SapB family protein [Elusimicrobiota bacterium]